MSQENSEEDLNEEAVLHYDPDPLGLFDLQDHDTVICEDSMSVSFPSQKDAVDCSSSIRSMISCSNEQTQSPDINLKRKLNSDENSSKVSRKNVQSEQKEQKKSLDVGVGCNWSVSDQPSTSFQSKLEPDDEQCKFKLKRIFSARKKSTLKLLVKNPFNYLGIPKNTLFVLRILSEKIPVPKEDIMITLRKLRLDEPYYQIGHDFGIKSPEKVERIFHSTLLVMNSYLSGLIFTPDDEKVRDSLPNSFKTSYTSVKNILYCMDLKIQKPMDRTKYLLTYSDTYVENTLKYLISFTPGGFITYVSNGHGGRISNEDLVNETCYFGTITSEIQTIMTNFRFLESSFPKEMSRLIRLSSIRSDVYMTNEDKWYVERYITNAIRSLEGFKMLTFNCLFDNNLLPYTNKIVTVSCAIHNLQFYSKNPIDSNFH